MEIFEDARVVSRADLAAWLRQLASQLESGGQIFYGAAGAVTVADQVHCELEIERESRSRMSVEIEFSWTTPEAAEPGEKTADAASAGEDDDEDDDEDGDEDGEEAEEREEQQPPDETGAEDQEEDEGDTAADTGEERPGNAEQPVAAQPAASDEGGDTTADINAGGATSTPAADTTQGETGSNQQG